MNPFMFRYVMQQMKEGKVPIYYATEGDGKRFLDKLPKEIKLKILPPEELNGKDT